MKHQRIESFDDVLSPALDIYIIARPSFLFDNFTTFLSSSGTTWKSENASDAELLIEAAGRICYMSFGAKQFRQDNKAYLSNLIESGHESVLEHASWSFLFTGVSRAFTHQLVRHRVGFSFSQLSQQYHDESETLFVAPAEIRSDPELLSVWAAAMRDTRDTYKTLLNRMKDRSSYGRKEMLRALRSAARSALPNCTETKLVVTANARALRHFLKVRGAIEGDIEMREVSAKLLQLLQSETANLFSDFAIDTHLDGFPIVRGK